MTLRGDTLRLNMKGTEKSVLKTQAAYYLATGIWPLLHRRSFEAVTGRKVDFWLVRTVGVTVAAVGAGLAQSARSSEPSPEMKTTALLTASGLGVIEFLYVVRGRISPLYLLDAAAEALFVISLARRRTRRPE